VVKLQQVAASTEVLLWQQPLEQRFCLAGQGVHRRQYGVHVGWRAERLDHFCLLDGGRKQLQPMSIGVAIWVIPSLVGEDCAAVDPVLASVRV